MKNIFIGLMLVVSVAFSNEVQLFTANSMHLKIRKDAVFTEQFCGAQGDYYVRAKVRGKFESRQKFFNKKITVKGPIVSGPGSVTISEEGALVSGKAEGFSSSTKNAASNGTGAIVQGAQGVAFANLKHGSAGSGAKGAGYGAATIIVAVTAGAIYDAIVSDHAYVYMTEVTNPDGSVTDIKTTIISNDAMTYGQVRKMALETQNNLKG